MFVSYTVPGAKTQSLPLRHRRSAPVVGASDRGSAALRKEPLVWLTRSMGRIANSPKE